MSSVKASNGETATTTPQTASGATGRDNHGRFAKGNPGGRGNPIARRVAAMRRALMDAVSEEDIAAIAKKMTEQARAGDVAAARLVFTYVVGRPQTTEDPDRLDEKEWQQYVQETVKEGELEAVIGGMSATLACTIAGSAVPVMQAHAGETLCANLAVREEGDPEKQTEPERPKQDATAGPEATPAEPSEQDAASDEIKARAEQVMPAVEDAAAKVLAMLQGMGAKANESVRRAANGPTRGGNRSGRLAPPPSPSSKGQELPTGDG